MFIYLYAEAKRLKLVLTSITENHIRVEKYIIIVFNLKHTLPFVCAAPPGGRDRRGRSVSLMSTPSFEPPAPAPLNHAIIKTKLQLVDLAGSECVGMSGVTGAALREASHINKSLSALADVLGALAENRPHVPYRNSRLTHFLQDSIGGNAKLLVLLCVAPAQRYITETTQCLGFGQRARQVQRGPTKRRLPSSAEKVGGPDRPGSGGKVSFR
ncbi:KIF25-like protein [Mya arenaria]|uniref:KIF25-like protein n=1 Tax=Mya arenaria TaxID=6604 RepID=A0ABY7ED71_MYAAR|nr:KIF25-like protein [Mya arenaria]